MACGVERARVVALIAALGMGACRKHEPPAPQALAESPAAVTGLDAGSAPDPTRTLAEAIREERWENAWVLFESLPKAVRLEPEVRYARARVASERHDARSTLASLNGLESALPLLADDIARRRAEAELDIGPFDAAGEWFFARGTPSALLRAARAFAKGKLDARARTACDRLLANEHRTRAQEAEARAMRLSLAPSDKSGDKGAIDDARWLAVHAPDLRFGKDAERALTKLAPSAPLTSDELLARAEAWSLAGKAEEATRAIDRATRAPGRKVSPLEALRAKGDAFYRGGKYGDAARILTQCAASGGTHVAEDAFRAARSLARADRDDEAILALDHVAKMYSSTPWGEQAEFLMGKLELLHARWAEATKTLDAYVTHHPNGQDKREAARDRALARFLTGDAHGARPLFEELAEDESDSLAAARARSMAALAAFQDGDRTHAIARWTDVAQSRPLSWPALVARARLAQIGAPLPPAIDPGDASMSAPGSDPGDGTASAASDARPLAIALLPPADSLHRLGLDDEAEDELHEREATIAAAAPGRSVEALCDAYGQLSRAKRRYQIAQQIPAALFATSPTPKTRWGWECAFPTPYAAEVETQERERAIPNGLLHAVMRQESGFDPDVVSPARAVGLLQLLPETARAVEAKLGKVAHHDDADDDDDAALLTSPAKNITLGAHYLADLIERFHGQLPLAIAAYNAGPDAITRWLSRRGDGAKLDLDLFVERIPYAETRVYVARVMGNFARYAYMHGGDAAVPTVRLELP